MIATAAALGAGAAAVVWLVLLVREATVYDRLLGGHALRVTLCVMLAGVGVAAQAPLCVDLAICAALLDAVLTLAGVKALQKPNFQPAIAPAQEEA